MKRSHHFSLLAQILLTAGVHAIVCGQPLGDVKSSHELRGTENHNVDTITVYEFHEIVVTATRNSVPVEIAPTSIASVSRQVIEAMPGSTLGVALGGVPGLFLRSYGGNGALQSVSLRGMGAEHTLVLVDGLRYTNFQNGQTDVGILSSANIQRVEVARGGHSSLYGADALGGVINIITRRPEAGMHGSFSTSLGSNGFNSNELSLSGTADSLGWRTFVRRERGRGNYDFDFNDGARTIRLRRSGADFQLLSTGARIELALSEAFRSWLLVSYEGAGRGVPGAVTDESAAGAARLDDIGARVQTHAEWSLSYSMSLQVNSSFHYSHETYRDPNILINNVSLDSYYTNRAVFVTPELHIALSPFLSGVVGADLVRASIASDEVLEAVRWQRSIFLSAEHTIAFPTIVPFEMVLYPSVRYDSFSDIGGDVSPKLGMNIGLAEKPTLRLRASVGKNFRVPTFNDLYWRDGGNPHLKPERSLSADGGIVASLGPINVEANYFSIRTRNRIVWTPGSGGIWSPKNIAEVSSKGVEAEVQWAGFGNTLVLCVNSTWTTTRKESEDYAGDPTLGKLLIYVPRQTVNASVFLSEEPFRFFVRHSWVSFRYTTEFNDRFLPHYATTSAAVTFSYLFGEVKAFLKLEASNLFNMSYEVIALYPMPLREIRGTLGVAL